MELNALEKSTNRNLASGFFERTPMTRRIVSVYDIVDRFLEREKF